MKECIPIAKLPNKRIQIVNKPKIWASVFSCINNNLNWLSTPEKIKLCHSI